MLAVLGKYTGVSASWCVIVLNTQLATVNWPHNKLTEIRLIKILYYITQLMQGGHIDNMVNMWPVVWGDSKSRLQPPTNNIVQMNPICPFWGYFPNLLPYPDVRLLRFHVCPPIFTSTVWTHRRAHPDIHLLYCHAKYGRSMIIFFLVFTTPSLRR